MSILLPEGFSLSVGSEAVSHDISLVLEHVDTVNNDALAFWQELVTYIAEVVNHGGLSGEAFEPDSSNWEASEWSQPDAHTLKIGVKVSSVDTGAWRVLLNLISASSIASYALSRVDIYETTRSGSILELDKAMQIPYPTYHATLPFILESSEEPVSSRIVQIEFFSPPPQERANDCIQALLAWDNICLGGYPEENEPPISNANDATEAYLFAPNIVEHPIPNYSGSEDAFNSIIAMAHWFHKTGSPVLSVRIE